MNSPKLMEQVRDLLRKYGEESLNYARKVILQQITLDEKAYEALKYFINELWFDYQHPALISLACEGVGGNPTSTARVGSAIVLLAGAADIHDDIIDRSRFKNSKPTIFKKFGMNVALLVGDALLFKGIFLLNEACEKLPPETKNIVLNLVEKAFIELGYAETKEISFTKKYDFESEKYWEIIEKKAGLAETCTRIGAIFGGGTQMEADMLGRFGKILGILMNIRDDFIDMFELEEIGNRFKSGLLPFPVFLALQNTRKKDKIISLLKRKRITEEDIQELLDLVMEDKNVHRLRKKMMLLINEGRKLLSSAKNKSILELLLYSTVEDL